MLFGSSFRRFFGSGQVYAGFGAPPNRDEAIEYFKKKQSENPDAPLVRIDENRQPAYDKLAILGYRHINEKEILFQPFCFFKIANIVVNMDKYICNIYLELIGKKEIWEQSMKSTSSVFYLENENVIELNKYKNH